MSPREMNQTEEGGFISWWMWTSTLKRGQKDPFKPSNQALFSARSGAVHMGPHNTRALLVHHGGDSREAWRPSDWELRSPFSDWKFPPGWSGAGLPSQIGI